MIDQKFKSDISFSYIAQGGTALASLLFMFVLTHYGSVSTYGALMLLTSLASVMGNLLSFRTNEALVAFYKQGETIDDLGRCKFAIVAGVVLDIVVGIVLFVIVMAASGMIAIQLLKDGNASGEVELFGYAILALMLKSSPLAFLQATERMKWVNAISLAETLGKLAIAACIGLGSKGMTLREAIWSTLVPAFASVLIAYLPLAKAVFTRLRTVAILAPSSLIGDYARFSLKTFTSSVLKAGNQNIDTLILGYLTDTRTAGIYATFRQFLSPLAFMSGPFAAIAYPRFVKAVVQRRHEEVRQMIVGVNRKLLLAFGAGIALILPAATIYIYVTDLQLDRASYFTLCFMAITAVLNGQLWWSRPFSCAVDPNISLRSNLLATAFVLVSIYPATTLFGIWGAALGMLALAILLTAFWKRALNSYA